MQELIDSAGAAILCALLFVTFTVVGFATGKFDPLFLVAAGLFYLAAVVARKEIK